MKSNFKPLHIYTGITVLVGVFSFLYFYDYKNITLSDWVIIFVLIGSITLLNYHVIHIPPKDNSLSLDSSIYLASLFMYGLDITLFVLALSSMVYVFVQRKIAWWKHLFNFSMYTIMIITSYFSLVFAGGTVGEIDTHHLLPYILSLCTYFICNMLFIISYFFLYGSGSIENVIKGVTSDKTFVISYFTTLLLPLILGILLKAEGIFGLFLFVCIALLLSAAFDQHFKLYQEISDKANKDFLTGLNNHGYFKELFDAEISSARENGTPVSLALLDIDDFKKYNDLYGHIQGDHLLTFFGSILENEADSHDYIVGRYGGEEFSIVMPNTTVDDGLAFVNSLRKKVNNSYFKGVEALPYSCLSFSAGVVEWEKGMYDASELLNKADQAMYYAKAQGKNIVQVFDENSQYFAQNAINLDNELNEAEQQLKIFLSKDVYTYRHSKRVFQYAVDFSSRLDLSESEKKTLILGALIHDIGKLEIPRDIINKKGKLEPHEWEMMKKHVTWGKEIISTNKKLEPLIPLVELHHERFDGKGYPHGLQGEKIPKLARILCVCDSFDAMTTERPYQKTKTFTEAIEELRKCSGSQFDPTLVEPFIGMIEEKYSNQIKEELALAVTPRILSNGTT